MRVLFIILHYTEHLVRNILLKLDFLIQKRYHLENYFILFIYLSTKIWKRAIILLVNFSKTEVTLFLSLFYSRDFTFILHLYIYIQWRLLKNFSGGAIVLRWWLRSTVLSDCLLLTCNIYSIPKTRMIQGDNQNIGCYLTRIYP